MTVPRFGLNRFDSRAVDAFAADVRRAETLGWDAAWQPDSQLRRRDTHQHQVWPDFHHAPDLEMSGRVVDFLPSAAADAFCLRGARQRSPSTSSTCRARRRWPSSTSSSIPSPIRRSRTIPSVASWRG